MKRILPSSLLVLLSVTPATVALAGAETATQQAVYNVREIPPPEDANCLPGYHRITFARRLNEKTQAAGYDFCWAATADPAAPVQQRGPRAFRWSRSSGSGLLPSLTPNSVETYGRDINNSGTVVGWEFDELGNARAPKWPLAGGVSDAIELPACDPFNQVFTRADGINDRGSIATSGFRIGANGQCRLGWVLKRATGEEIVAEVLGGSLFSINIHDVMVGSSQNNAVKWSPATGPVVLATGSPTPLAIARAWSINDRNQAVGYVDRFDDSFCLVGSDARFWAADGTERALPGLPGAPFVGAVGINKQGDVVGYSQYEGDCVTYDPTQWRATVWHNRRPEDVNDLIPRRIAREVQLIIAASINDHGEIVARGIRPDTQLPCPGFVFNPVTGEQSYDPSLMCYPEHAFLLTPR